MGVAASMASGLPPHITGLLALTQAVPEQEVTRAAEKPSRLAQLGNRGLAAFDGSLSSIAFLGEVTESFVRLLLLRFRLRWRDFWVVVQVCFVCRYYAINFKIM